MTTNQIAYNTLLENQRHNKAVEYEGYRHNVAVEDYNNRSLMETNRHNLATESLQKYDTDLRHIASKYAAELSANATRYAADRNYAASIYSSNAHLAASRYSADQARASSQFATMGNLISTGITASTSRYNTRQTNKTKVGISQAENRNRTANNIITQGTNIIQSGMELAGSFAGLLLKTK